MKIESSMVHSSSSMQFARHEENIESIRIANTANTNQSDQASVFEEAPPQDAKLRTMMAILEELMGKKITMKSFHTDGAASLTQRGVGADGDGRVGWGLEIRSEYALHESQSLDINSSGRVMTEDGREIDFSLHVQFHREFSMTQSSVIRAGDPLTDPLVISLDGGSPIGEGRFSFDLLQGGELEEIPHLSAGSGFLTLDKNRDGKVNDGSELFGPESGEGFLELATLDDDKNGWIDENDAVFKRLKIWIKTAEDDQTMTLKEAGIGALSLHAVEGNFDFKDSENNTIAQLQKTSVALSEDGNVKPLYELDVAS